MSTQSYAHVNCKKYESTGLSSGLSLLSENDYTSGIFPAYFPADRTIAFPTPQELVTKDSGKYESAAPLFTVPAESVFTGYYDIDPVKNASSGITISSYDTNVVRLSQGSYEAEYSYYYEYVSSADGNTIKRRIVMTYYFAAVKNKYPTKPWTIKSVVERILDLAEPRLIIRYHKDTGTYEGGIEFRHVILTCPAD